MADAPRQRMVVSDHALLAYLSRVMRIDVETVREKIYNIEGLASSAAPQINVAFGDIEYRFGTNLTDDKPVIVTVVKLRKQRDTGPRRNAVSNGNRRWPGRAKKHRDGRAARPPTTTEYDDNG